jgi:hypothetical protein
MLLTHPDPMARWAQTLGAVQVPVLRSTRDALAAWQQMPERADANSLAHTVLHDPLMTLRVLICVHQRLGSRLRTPVETVTAGIVMLGIEPFFTHLGDPPVLEDRLAHEPLALAGALQAIERAHRAARLAAAFAIQRQDEDAEVLHQADATLRSADVQRAVLGVELAALQHALAAQWGLPDFLRSLSEPGQWARPGPRCVMLAVRIARHSQTGWDNAALPDDYAELGQLLNISSGAAGELVREVCE